MSTSMFTPTTTKAMAPEPAKAPAAARQCCYLLSTNPGRRVSVASAKKKNPWLDPFDDGPDEEFDYQGVFSGGKQEEDPRPPENPANPYGFLRFPQGYNPELDSLASKVRGDVRRACCVVSGGVYENVLFFPVVQLLKDRYPGVLVDVVASARGKQVYEMCKNVRYANVYDPDDDWPEPAEYTHQLGVLKNRYYDLILSTRLAGIGHALFLFMSSARDKVGYVYPNVNSAGAGLFLNEMFKPPTTNLADGGYNMYNDMLEWIARPAKDVPRQPTPPLRVSISKKLRAYVEDKYNRAGVQKGKYVVVHGIASDSVANMKSRGDDDCLLPLEHWAQIAKEISSSDDKGLKPLFVIPHEKHREEIEEIVGEDTNILFITTPGQLTCLINDSAGVVATNTAAVQLANARDKPCVALFSSTEKVRLFLPYVEDKSNFTVVASATGKLIDVDIEAVKKAVKNFEPAPSFALAQK
ncbi:photosynthetic NDH subunit of subcomplex B 1, chloroplastic-like isoform X1 [Phragmites australis]|uniref:photosynthetic NDH subunit of subcomplex B 1, chloroplastic-like isoform X1 n=1 Tax=Phragmites australis TaxID=29695 RepID=UPI002D769A38|nr:photosynthetic NDH subunit of subcomplex B 1, chloroplastic-like isoform X1 [Phragmites australis]